jgi:hypothetical protein
MAGAVGSAVGQSRCRSTWDRLAVERGKGDLGLVQPRADAVRQCRW